MDPNFTTEGWALTSSLDSRRLDTDEPFCWQKFEPSSIILSIQSSGLHLLVIKLQSHAAFEHDIPVLPHWCFFVIICWGGMAVQAYNVIHFSLILCPSLSMNQILTAICQVRLQLIYLKLHLTNGDLQVGWVQLQWIQAVAVLLILTNVALYSCCLNQPNVVPFALTSLIF